MPEGPKILAVILKHFIPQLGGVVRAQMPRRLAQRNIRVIPRIHLAAPQHRADQTRNPPLVTGPIPRRHVPAPAAR